LLQQEQVQKTFSLDIPPNYIVVSKLFLSTNSQKPLLK